MKLAEAQIPVANATAALVGMKIKEHQQGPQASKQQTPSPKTKATVLHLHFRLCTKPGNSHSCGRPNQPQPTPPPPANRGDPAPSSPWPPAQGNASQTGAVPVKSCEGRHSKNSSCGASRRPMCWRSLWGLLEFLPLKLVNSCQFTASKTIDAFGGGTILWQSCFDESHRTKPRLTRAKWWVEEKQPKTKWETCKMWTVMDRVLS